MKFDFQQDYILENDMVKLRPLVPTDFDLLLPFSIDEPTLWTYSTLPANGEENLKNYLNVAFNKKREMDSYPFLVFDKRMNTVAGSTRFYDFQESHNTVQLGYTWYGQKFWGTGLNKNCKYLMLDFAFEQLQLDRVEFRADATNARSIAAMKSIGCTVEGILRSNCNGAAGRRDSIVLSILRNEWEESIKNNLHNKLIGK